MKEKYRKYATLILVTIFFVQLTLPTYAQESLSADTPFIEVNGKTIKFGSAIIAFSKIRQSNMKFDDLKPHKLNPVLIGNINSRNAGTIYYDADGNLIRPWPSTHQAESTGTSTFIVW